VELRETNPVNELLQTLRERGFIQKTTDDETDDKPLAKLLATRPITAYAGFDPTASSFHVGNLVPILGLVHLQQARCRPIAIVGGGTGMVGDPSGKTELRKVLAADEVQANLEAQKAQLSRFFEIGAAPPAARSGENPIRASGLERTGFVLNNADWLARLNYLEFLRDIGRHFSVNRMLAAESVKLRLESESGLSFLEFNYSLLQAYDFLVLNERYGCELQVGGGDQWGNIVAGTDLIRRVTGRRAHGITFPLVMTADGKKMGKTEKGAVWLDASRTSPYEYYQYWINVDDRDAGRFLRMFTFLPIEEIAELEKLTGSDIRVAKQRLAFEATLLAHGREQAEKACDAARALFGGQRVVSSVRVLHEAVGQVVASMTGLHEAVSVPSHVVARADLEKGLLAVQLFADSGLCESKSAAKRMARQGGLYVNGDAIPEERVLTAADLKDGAILLRAGKKKHVKVACA
jgi:tyrosyl-tRNA synthetase